MRECRVSKGFHRFSSVLGVPRRENRRIFRVSRAAKDFSEKFSKNSSERLLDERFLSSDPEDPEDLHNLEDANIPGSDTSQDADAHRFARMQ